MSIGAGVDGTYSQAIDQQSASLVGRATAVMQQVPGLDHQTAVTLAQQPTSNDQLQQQAQNIGDTLAQTWDGYEHAFFDPTLQAQPSTAQAVADYLHSTLGPPAVSSGSINQLQSSLIKDGFLDASGATGVWDSASESAYNAAVNSYKTDALAGAHKPLSSKVSSLVHSIFHDATHPWDMVSGWYDSAVQAVGDAAGELGAIADTAIHGQGFLPLMQVMGYDNAGQAAHAGQFSASISQHFMNALTSGNTSQAAQEQIHKNPLNVLGDVVSVTGATAVARSALKGVIEQAGKGAAEQVAAKAPESLIPGTLGEGATTTAEHLDNAIAMEKIGAAISGANKLGFIGRSIDDIGNALRARTLPASDPAVQRSLGIVTKTLLKAGGAAGSVAGKVLVGNPDSLVSKAWEAAVPGLARLAPVATPIAKLGALADKLGIDSSQGFAYTVRNAIATPYMVAPVRAAGIAYQRASIGSIAGHAIASSLPGSQLQQNVDSTKGNVLDSFLDNTKIPIPGLGHLSLSALPVGFLHGDLAGAGRASSVVGDMVSGWTNHLASQLGDVGMPAAFQQALGLSRADLLAQAGGSETRLGLWMNNKLNDYAADTYAQRQVAANFTGGKADEVTALTAAKNEWHALPDAQKKQWVATVVKADPHMQGFQTRIKQDLLRNTVDPKAAVRASLDRYMSDTDALQKFIASGGAHYMIGPDGHAMEKADQNLAPGELAQLTVHPAGAVGMQGVDVKTGAEMRNDATGLQSEFSAAPTEAAREAAITKMIDYLHTEGNMDASRLQIFERNPEALIAQINKVADSRAEEMLPTADQPEWVADHIAALKADGKRIVLGTHIGHVYDGTLPQLATMDGWQGAIRRWAGKVGLDPQRIPDVEVAHAIRQDGDANVHRFLSTDKDAKLATQHADFRTVRATVDHLVQQGQMNPVFSGLFSLTSKIGLNKSEIQRIIKESGGTMTAADAEAQIKNKIGSQFGLRDIPKKTLIQQLRTTQEIAHGTADGAGSFTWHGVDQHTATGIVNALHAAYRQPGYMMGLEMIENWARAGFGVGDKLMARNPNNPLYRAVSNWPNSLLRARNQLRFTVSPIFAARVATKQRYKAALEGVPIPFNPLKSLMASGQDEAALNALTRIGGKVPSEQMDADRYLATRDVFGIHDSQWDKAYFVHAKLAQGASTAEVKASLNKVFGYGTDGGRSALERTANTIFFPFSFDKTLYRNTGGFILDHPGTALMLDNAVEQWRVLDKDHAVGKWVNDHLPILQELQLFNAFSHGISPGQFGGINAPILNTLGKGPAAAAGDVASGKSEALLNLLLPQSWGPNLTPKNLAKYLPIWKQLGTLMSNVHQQLNIAGAAAHDTTSQILGYGWRPEPTLTSRAQISAALAKKAQLESDPGVRAILDYNYKQSSNADKYQWPDSPKLPQAIRLQPVNKTTINLYMQYLYPAYNPQKAVDFAVQNAGQAKLFIANVARTDPAKAQALTAFSALANQVIGHLNKDEYDPATSAQVQGEFHDAAQKLAEQDPQWLAFYTKFYKASLGPIVGYSGKAAA